MKEFYTVYFMEWVTLIFQDVQSIADFVLENGISNSEVNSSEHKLTGLLSDEQINLACNDYNAVRHEKFVFSFSDESDD
jgi:hypothetical protein